MDTELGHLRPEDKARFVPEEKKVGKKAGGGDGPDLSSLGPPLSAAEGAATALRVASSPEVEGITGRYVADLEVTELTPVASDVDAAARLWSATEDLLADLGVR